MSKKQQAQNQPETTFLFEKRNYVIMVIGLVIIAIGYILMAGGGSDDPNVFNEAMYSFRRIRLAPTLVLLGLGIQIYAIFAQPKK